MKKQIINRLLDGAIVVTLLVAFTQAASAVPRLNVPDGGTTAGLMGIACAGLTVLRRFRR